MSRIDLSLEILMFFAKFSLCVDVERFNDENICVRVSGNKALFFVFSLSMCINTRFFPSTEAKKRFSRRQQHI